DDNSELVTFFHRIQRARNAAEVVAERYAETDEANTRPHAFMHNLAGLSYIFLGENFCSGVPYGSTDLEGRLTCGAGNTTAEIFEDAVARFDQAFTTASAGGASDQANLARVGKARSLLNLGRYAEAAAV